MTNKELGNILLDFVKKGNCFTKEVHDDLLEYKKSGGQQVDAKQILEKIKTSYPDNETIQDGADDILDMVTGYCSVEMSIWK